MHEFTRIVRAKGWNTYQLAERWGITTRGLTKIASNPRQRDWDALVGLPLKEIKR